MHQLFKGLSKTAPLFTKPTNLLAMNQLRVFASRHGHPDGAETTLADVGEIFKTNYVIEFDQGLSDD
jgi:succinate dehydrogenase (ubiquinone) iron-sulfur subunit